MKVLLLILAAVLCLLCQRLETSRELIWKIMTLDKIICSMFWLFFRSAMPLSFCWMPRFIKFIEANRSTLHAVVTSSIWFKTYFKVLSYGLLSILMVAERPKIKFFIFGGYFSHPIDKICNIEQALTLQSVAIFRGSFYFWGLFFAFRGQNRPEPPCIFSPGHWSHCPHVSSIVLMCELHL